MRKQNIQIFNYRYSESHCSHQCCCHDFRNTLRLSNKRCHSAINSFHKHVLSTYFMLDPVTPAVEIERNLVCFYPQGRIIYPMCSFLYCNSSMKKCSSFLLSPIRILFRGCVTLDPLHPETT